MGYDLWADAAIRASTKAFDIDEVINAMGDETGPNPQDFDANIKRFLSPSWVPDTSVPLALCSGPCSTFDLVPSGNYPQEANAIANIFNPTPEAAAPQPQAVMQPQMVTVAIQGEAEKEAEAKKGIIKLMLLHICGDVDFDLGTVSNITQATPSKGMECVLAVARAARPQAYSDLLKKTCTQAAMNDPLHIRSTHMTMKVVQKTVASNLLGGNFATEPVSTSFLNEANSIDPSIFMPQRNSGKVDQIKQSELAFCNEVMMDVPDVQKTRPKTVMSRIGVLSTVNDFSSICINIDTIISGTVEEAPGSPKPILRQLMLDFINMVNGPSWKHWMEISGAEMPNVHITLYGYLESVWIGLATFATDFNNGNVISEGRPLTELRLAGIKSAVRSYKAFKEAFLNAQASNGAITHVPLHLRFATSEPTEAPTSATGRVRDGSAASASRLTTRDGASRSSLQANGRTRDGVASTSNSTEARNSGDNQGGGRSSTKRAKRSGLRFDTANPDRGMFYLRNTSMNMNDVFPNDIPRICPYFTCKGKECTKDPEQCALHPERASDLGSATIAKIGKHFIDKNIGWFNEYHFGHGKVELSPELKAICGNRRGPTAHTQANQST